MSKSHGKEDDRTKSPSRSPDAFTEEDQNEQLHFSAAVRGQPRMDDLRRGTALHWFLSVADRGRAVRDCVGASGDELDPAIGGISQRDGPSTSAPVQRGRLGRIQSVARPVPPLTRQARHSGSFYCTLTGTATFASFVAREQRQLINEARPRAPAVGEASPVIVAEAAGFEPARGWSPQPA